MTYDELEKLLAEKESEIQRIKRELSETQKGIEILTNLLREKRCCDGTN